MPTSRANRIAERARRARRGRRAAGGAPRTHHAPTTHRTPVTPSVGVLVLAPDTHVYPAAHAAVGAVGTDVLQYMVAGHARQPAAARATCVPTVVPAGHTFPAGHPTGVPCPARQYVRAGQLRHDNAYDSGISGQSGIPPNARIATRRSVARQRMQPLAHDAEQRDVDEDGTSVGRWHHQCQINWRGRKRRWREHGRQHAADVEQAGQ